MRPTKERPAERLERSKLREFFEDVIRPQLERDNASKSHLERHAAAIEYVERFSKSPLSPDDVDEQLVLNFDGWLWRQEISDGRRRDIVESLRRIIAIYTPDPSKLRTNRRQRRRLPDPAEGTLRRFFEDIYIAHRLAGRTARHVDDCRMVLYRLYEHFTRDIALNEQTDALASSHVTWLIDHGLSPTTINNHLACWFAVWRHAHDLGAVEKGPTLRKLPKIHETPDAWSAEEMAAILDSCDVAWDKRIAGQHRAGDWWRALIFTVWYTGLRRRALMAVRRDDVDLQSGWLRVRGDAMKNRRGKPFRLGPDCLGAIRSIWDPPRSLLFYFPHDRGMFYDQFHRILKASGVPRGDSNAGCLHKIRRSAATAIAATQGIGAAQTILGHRSMSVTERYIDVSKIPGSDFSKALPELPTKPRLTTFAAG